MKQRKHILWLCSWYPHSKDLFDGDFIERQARAIAAIHNVHVIHLVQNRNILKHTTPTCEIKEEYGLQSSVYFINNYSNVLNSPNTLLFNIRYHRKLYAVLKDYIAQNGKPDLVHVQVPVKIGLGAVWLQKQSGIPFIVTEHYNVYHNNNWDGLNTASAYFKRLTKCVITKSNALVTVSDFLGNAINTYAVKRPYFVIPNVVNTELFFYKPPVLSKRKFRFLHVSNMMPVKNPKLMLDAVAKVAGECTDVEFVFAGNTSDEWKRYAASIGIAENVVQFKGVLPYEKIAYEMQEADAFFIFSKSETFSCATAEALCCGLPVAAVKAGALPELLNSSNAVFADKENNAESFAKVLQQLKESCSQFNRNEIAEEASAKYNYRTVALQYDALYKLYAKHKS
ncbi:MAG: glycosyltransferase [Chitinophagaceae bacterium]|nr:glycosyltransferase [Chitinophagaceae bacterium]